ncbi:uncharacterized protein LOC132203777 [Neocloeon triangulifer]|uniref:uncharacterized protein LOC132203777 n=1 Tax=Neocloeon triangulifer TaxID=2078957 RepID=UPI00286F1C30|nr:uncharacterized protein LOC132203777 [Neocloeon triangulifer]
MTFCYIMSSNNLINFGYILDDQNTPARTWVLVIHHGFENHEDPRVGNDKDIENLRATFTRRNCVFVDLKSNTRNSILSKITNQDDLFQLFTGKADYSQNDAPAVLFVFILSHGRSGGAIETDHIDPATNDCEIYYQKDVWEGLAGMICLQKCLKVLFFGPCRGSNEELRLPTLGANIEKPLKKDDEQNREVPIWGSSGPNCENFIIFYSAVESTKAQRNSHEGSWFVHEFCKELNKMSKNCDFTIFLTRVQKQISLRTSKHNTFIGQTPQLHIFKHKKFTVYGTYPLQVSPRGNQRGESKQIGTDSEERQDFYPWKSREDLLFRRGRALIFYDSKHSKKAEEAKKSFLFLEFETKTYGIKQLECVLKKVSNANDCGLQEEGCFAVCIMASLIDNKDDGLTICTDELRKPVNELITPLIGVNCKDLSGKPKLFFFLDNGGQEDDRHVARTDRDWEVPSNNHAEIFTFVGIGQPHGKNIVTRLINGLRNPQLKCGLSLQEAVVNVIRAGDDDATSKGQIKPQVSSTLHNLLDFSPCKNTYIKPSFARGNENVSFDQLSHEIAESAKDQSQEEGRNRFWLINAAAGYGKLAATIEMAKALADLLPEFQIINFSLMRICKYLKDVQTNGADTADVRDFLKKASQINGSDLAQFEEKFVKKQIVVLVDGYDSVLTYEDVVLQFLTEIYEKQLCLWVASRPHQLSKIIEKNFQLSQLKICPMSREEQLNLLRTMLFKNAEECEELLSKLKPNNDYGVPFTGTPLQLKMIAEIADDVVEGMSISSLYHKFLFSKLDSALNKTYGTDKSKRGYYELIQRSVELLMVAAFNCVYREKLPSPELKLSVKMEKDIRQINQLGIASITSEDGEVFVIFEHQTYAEYLISMFFLTKAGHYTNEDCECYLENVDDINLSDLFLRNQFEQVRLFIDGFFVGSDSESKIQKTKLDECCQKNDLQSKSAILISYVCKEGLARLFKLFFESEYRETFENIPALINTPYCYKYRGENFQYYPLYAACYSNDEELALHLLNLGADIKLLDPKRCHIEEKDTLLHLAVKKGLEKVIDKIMMVVPQMIVDENRNGKSPLDIAAEQDNLDCVKRLITKPTLPDSVKLSLRKRALRIAAKKGNVKMVSYLMNGAFEDPYLQEDSENVSPLYFAACHGNIELMKYLIDNDARIDINVEGTDGYTPIQVACENGSVEAVKILLECGANINSVTKERGSTLLQLAVWSNKLACVEFLLQNSVDIDRVDKNGETAFHYAAGYSKCLDILIKLKNDGANIHCLSTSKYGDNNDRFRVSALDKSAMYCAVECLRYLLQLKCYSLLVKKRAFWKCLAHHSYMLEELADTIEVFLQDGLSADMDFEDMAGNKTKPIIIMAEKSSECLTKRQHWPHERPQTAQTLHEEDSQANEDGPFYHIPVEIALVSASKDKNAYMKCIQLLIDNGANPSPALYTAAKGGDHDLIEMLLKNGADVNYMVYSLETALHKAAKEGQLKAAKILLSKGANINAETKFGISPLSLAVEEGHAGMVEYLLERGADTSSLMYASTLLVHDEYAPITQAARKAREDLVNMILAKAPTELKQKLLSLSLLGAIRAKNEEFFEMLISLGADIEVFKKDFPHETISFDVNDD